MQEQDLKTRVLANAIDATFFAPAFVNGGTCSSI
jgi:hypothetical protein